MKFIHVSAWEKEDLSDFKYGMVVCDRWAGLRFQ